MARGLPMRWLTSMADDDKDSKTEDPTEKRLGEATERGEFAKSPEIGVVLGLGAALLAFSLVLQEGTRSVADYSSSLFAHLHTVPFQAGVVPPPLVSALKIVAIAVAPLLVGATLAALLAGGLQSGFRLSPKAIGFKPEKLNPVDGFKRLFSQRMAVHAGIDFCKMLAVGTCIWIAMRELLADPLFTTPVETPYLGEFIREAALSLLSRLALVLGCVAAASYAYEKFKTRQDQRMSRHEVKEEHKQAEGNAQVKGAIRRMARRLAQRQMLAAVPTADVIVTNPTHYAVALKYERGVDSAPVILAKGENAFARRIKELAARHEVPMVENRPVARLLHATGRVGEPIPAELFHAVAGILAFVYRTHRYYFHRLASRRLAVRAPGGPTS